MVDLYVDPTLKRGIVKALFAQIHEAIVSGRFAAGDRLPSSRELAAELGVSRHTVTTVYGRLVAEGYLDGRAGGGTVVSGGFEARRSSGATSVLRPASEVGPDPSVTEPAPPGGFDLRIGQPDPTLFPLVQWRRCVVSALQTHPDGYGEPGGIDELRRSLAQWVGRSRGVEATPEQVLVTAGAQQGVDLVARVLLRPGDRVAVEDPGYPPVRLLLEAMGLRVVPVPVDHDGLVVDDIPTSVRAVYTTPSHQSPTGATTTLARRRALLAFAEDHDVAIIEDDYDSEYRHSDRPLEPLHRIDRSGRVIYLGTFSKVLSPSLRLGFVVLPTSLVDAALAWRKVMDVQSPAVTQRAMHRFITDGLLEAHLRKVSRIYRDRHELVATAVSGWITEGIAVPGPDNHAGLHLSVGLAPGAPESDVVARAQAAGIAIAGVGRSAVLPRVRQDLLIGFGLTPAPRLAEALDRLGDVLRSE